MTTHDKALFQQAMQGVQPLAEYDRILPSKPKAHKTTHHHQQQRTDATITNQTIPPFISPTLNDAEPPPSVKANDILQFGQPGIQKRLLQRLRKTRCNENTVLDLHGFTVEEAYPALIHFLNKAQQQAQYTVRIIHGKGRHTDHPVLKNKVNHWLRQLDNVLAFCSSCQQDGGSGAVNVLLKKNR